MRDTFVALPSVTEGGSVLLAKTVDTEVNEPRNLVNRIGHPVSGAVWTRFKAATALDLA